MLVVRVLPLQQLPEQDVSGTRRIDEALARGRQRRIPIAVGLREAEEAVRAESRARGPAQVLVRDVRRLALEPEVFVDLPHAARQVCGPAQVPAKLELRAARRAPRES